MPAAVIAQTALAASALPSAESSDTQLQHNTSYQLRKGLNWFNISKEFNHMLRLKQELEKSSQSSIKHDLQSEISDAEKRLSESSQSDMCPVLLSTSV